MPYTLNETEEKIIEEKFYWFKLIIFIFGLGRTFLACIGLYIEKYTKKNRPLERLSSLSSFATESIVI